MTDEQIPGGFANLHQAMMTGFDAMRAEMQAMRLELRNEFRNEISGFEHRLMRRCDRIDDRLDDHERRIGALETRG